MHTANGNIYNNFVAYLKALQLQASGMKLSYQEKWLNQTVLLDQMSLKNNAVLFLWDVAASQLIYMNDKNYVLGDPAGTELSAIDGLAYLFSNIHPDYQHAALLFHQTTIDYCLTHNEQAPAAVVSNFNFQYKRKNGGYMQLLQHAVVAEADARGQPLLFLCFGYDITYLLKEHTANLIITAPQRFSMWCYNFDKRHLEPIAPFTVQEKKVLQFLYEGRHTKEISDELYNSPHTIDTHRRNLLKKTGCVDTTALVTYLKMVGFPL